jgi:hypothetical protein
MVRPPAQPATVPADMSSDDDYVPGAGAPRPAKAPTGHPAEGAPSHQGAEAPRNQTSPNPPGHGAVPEPRNQGTTEPGRLSSAERRKLGSRIDPWIKQTLKMASAVEGRKEEALVEAALLAYLYQHHGALTAGIKAQHDAQQH